MRDPTGNNDILSSGLAHYGEIIFYQKDGENKINEIHAYIWSDNKISTEYSYDEINGTYSAAGKINALGGTAADSWNSIGEVFGYVGITESGDWYFTCKYFATDAAENNENYLFFDIWSDEVKVPLN